MAAIGIDGGVTIAAGTASTGTIKPPAGQKYIIHNIWVNGPCFIRHARGSVIIDYEQITVSDSIQGRMIHISDAQWIDIRNNHATNALEVLFDGVLDA